MRTDEESSFVFPFSAGEESWRLVASTSDLKSTIWHVSADLRPSMKLTLRRVKTYTSNKVDDNGNIVKEGRDTGHKTELECLGKTLTITPVKIESGSQWLLLQWINQLDVILSKYELSGVAMTPQVVNDPDSFVRAIITSTKYKEGFLETPEKK